MLKNIIFDIGNVLSDFRWKEFLMDQGYDEAMAERMGDASVRTQAWHLSDRGDYSEEEILEMIVANDPKIEQELRSAFADWHEMVRPRAYAIPWVCELKERGYRVYYLSNWPRRATVECGDVLAFLPYTDGGILSYQEHLIKPDPAIFQCLLERYQLKAEESVFVDDTLVNVEAAQKLGLMGIHFISKEQTEEEIRRLTISHR